MSKGHGRKRNMKRSKLEKVMELTPIEFGINKERDSQIARKWTHKGLDFLLEMYHKYYNTTSHLCIHSLLLRFSERQLNLNVLDEALKHVTEREMGAK